MTHIQVPCISNFCCGKNSPMNHPIETSGSQPTPWFHQAANHQRPRWGMHQQHGTDAHRFVSILRGYGWIWMIWIRGWFIIRYHKRSRIEEIVKMIGAGCYKTSEKKLCGVKFDTGRNKKLATMLGKRHFHVSECFPAFWCSWHVGFLAFSVSPFPQLLRFNLQLETETSTDSICASHMSHPEKIGQKLRALFGMEICRNFHILRPLSKTKRRHPPVSFTAWNRNRRRNQGSPQMRKPSCSPFWGFRKPRKIRKGTALVSPL